MMCTATLPANRAAHASTTKPQCNGAEEFFHEPECMTPSLRPTFGKLISGLAIAIKRGNDVPLLYSGNRVLAYRKVATPMIMYIGNAP